MSQFLKIAHHAKWINARDVTQIVGIHDRKQRSSKAYAQLREGNKFDDDIGVYHSIYGIELEGNVGSIVESLFPIIPAQPGFFELRCWHCEDEIIYRKIPIGAWRCVDSHLEPITHEPDLSRDPDINAYHTAVLYPTGTVVDIMGELYCDSEEVWKEQARHTAEWAKERWDRECEKLDKEDPVK